MTAPHIDDYRWLTSTEATETLTDLLRTAKDAGNVPATKVRIAARLREFHSPTRVHLLLEQLELRERAREKFSGHDRLFFTRKGLEQATDEGIAAYKARRFPQGAPVADLCCGIGGDLLALAGRGPVSGYEADETTAHLARANLHLQGFDPTSVHCQRAIAGDVQPASAWHIDPDRRAAGSRVVELADYEPGPAFLRELLAVNPNGAVKVAPAALLKPEAWPPCEREWIESRGECRQQVLWFGGLSNQAGMHTATEVSHDQQSHSFTEHPDQPLTHADSIGRYLYEPAPSILAAHLAGALANAHQLLAITPGGGYLTADALREHSLSSSFRVRDVLSFDLKKLRAYCREHQLGRLEIKKRGVDVDPARVRKQIIAQGENSAVIFVTPLARSVKAIIADRV